MACGGREDHHGDTLVPADYRDIMILTSKEGLQDGQTLKSLLQSARPRLRVGFIDEIDNEDDLSILGAVERAMECCLVIFVVITEDWITKRTGLERFHFSTFLVKKTDSETKSTFSLIPLYVSKERPRYISFTKKLPTYLRPKLIAASQNVDPDKPEDFFTRLDKKLLTSNSDCNRRAIFGKLKAEEENEKLRLKREELIREKEKAERELFFEQEMRDRFASLNISSSTSHPAWPATTENTMMPHPPNIAQDVPVQHETFSSQQQSVELSTQDQPFYVPEVPPADFQTNQDHPGETVPKVAVEPEGTSGSNISTHADFVQPSQPISPASGLLPLHNLELESMQCQSYENDQHVCNFQSDLPPESGIHSSTESELSLRGPADNDPTDHYDRSQPYCAHGMSGASPLSQEVNQPENDVADNTSSPRELADADRSSSPPVLKLPIQDTGPSN